MKKYKVEFIQTETFIVDVLAQDEQEATDKATVLFDEGAYKEEGDCQVSIGTVYEDIQMLEEENRNMAEALLRLGYTRDQISDICSGAI